MKQLRFRRIAGLTLVFLLVFSFAAAGTAFLFRGGITWDTTVAGMMAAEGLRDGGGNFNREDRNGFTFFYLKTENVYYVFRGDLLMTAYSLLPGGSDAYAAEQNRQAVLYGAPADVPADTVSALLNLLLPGSTAPDDFERLTAWRLSDGTLAALFSVGGENYLAYLHEQRILGGV